MDSNLKASILVELTEPLKYNLTPPIVIATKNKLLFSCCDTASTFTIFRYLLPKMLAPLAVVVPIIRLIYDGSIESGPSIDLELILYPLMMDLEDKEYNIPLD